jgi:hypothetical protein
LRPSSSRAAARLTWAEESEISGPRSRREHLDHAAGGHALNIHLGEREIHRLIGSRALLESGWIELAGTHLGHLEGHFTQPGEHGLGFETVGVIAPGCGAFVGCSTQKLISFDLGRFIDKDAQGFPGPIETVFEQCSISRFQRVRFDSHRHDTDTPLSKSWPHAPAAPPCRYG